MKRLTTNERGNAVLEFIVIAVAVFMPIVYIVISVATVHAANMAASHAVREATRSFMMAATPSEASSAARSAARLALANHGLALEANALTLQCNGTCLAPGSSVEATLRWNVPLPWMPEMLRGPATVPVLATHTLPIDAYRSSP
jgi:Flp pilus assembly protein TadG